MRTLFQFTQSCFGGVMIGWSWLNYSSMNSKILAGGNWKSGALIRISEWTTLLQYPMIVNGPFCYNFKKEVILYDYFVNARHKLFCSLLLMGDKLCKWLFGSLFACNAIFWVLFLLTWTKTWPLIRPQKGAPESLLTKSTCTMTQLILSLFKVVVTYAIYFYLILQHTSF